MRQKLTMIVVVMAFEERMLYVFADYRKQAYRSTIDTHRAMHDPLQLAAV